MKRSEKQGSRVAYFDCFSGISGDMVIGALLHAGADMRGLKGALSTLPLGKYRISARKARANFISGIKFDVVAGEQRHGVGIKRIRKMIGESGLPAKVAARCLGIFDNLARAEARVHGIGIDDVHFHEVGATDSIIDIVGSVSLLHDLGVESVYSSVPRLGSGLTRCSHGTMPVPAPATVELLKGVPVASAGRLSELVTPTGAALLTALSSGYGDLPAMSIERVGYGVGSRKTVDLPNCLRIIIGKGGRGALQDEVDVLTTNIDDMNPQVYDFLMERLYEHGALEVYLQGAQMKKNRPGVLVTVISPPHATEGAADILFRETGTLGVRITRAHRRKLERESATVKTGFGSVRMKIGRGPGERLIVRPEYDDLKRIAGEEGLPLIEVHDRVMKEAAALTGKKRKKKKG